MDILILPASLFIGLLLLFLFYKIVIRNSSSSKSSNEIYTHHEPRKPIHRFTDKEILSQGIDVRNPKDREELILRRGRRERQIKTLASAEKIISKK
jgi:flagellar biosynthesis/type III secretory pathway M-ring protein FliF/YscJ